MRRMIQAVTIATVFATVLAAPALADEPVTFSHSETFTDVNPCTELEHEITLNFEISIHQHQNNLIAKVRRSGSTDDGYTMAGTETFVANKGGERTSFVDQWRNPDGSKFMVHGNSLTNANKDEVLVESFSLTCIGNS